MLPLILFAFLSGADLTGIWSADIAPSVPLTLTLNQTGDSITGTEQLADRSFQIENARVENDKLTFSLPIPSGGRLRNMSVAATLQNGELHLRDTRPELVLKRIVPDPEFARVTRLGALIRLWGAIRFFHPWIAYRPIDWDAALIAAIPVDDLTRATSKMLSILGDPETRILAADELDPQPIPCQCRSIVRSGFFNDAPAASAPYYVDWETVDKRVSHVMRLPGGIRVAIRTAEPSGTNGNEIKTYDNPYEADLPEREFRLLALARYWNTIHYFYGYPDLLEAWDSALTEFIPQFEHAQTRRDYLFAISRLASRTHDGHSITSLNGEFGMQNLVFREIAGQTVVTGDAAPGLKRGDVITTVGGEPASDRKRFLLDLFPHSTPWSGAWLADRYLLAGPDPRVTVGVQTVDGKEEKIEIARDLSSWTPTPGNPIIARLPSGLGYIDLTRLMPADVDRAFDAIMDAPALILDLRGYPKGAFANITARLTDHPVAAALIRQRVWHGPDPAAAVDEISVQHAYPNGKSVYRGRVAVLIDTRAFSQSEHTCLFLEAATKILFVGTPTAGNDGEVTTMVLPGGVRANFAGMNISHADGRPLQRVGILPDVWAEPTIKGIQEGRDEILDAAIDVLTRK